MCLVYAENHNPDVSTQRICVMLSIILGGRQTQHTPGFTCDFPSLTQQTWGSSSFAGAWRTCVGNPGFGKRSTWPDNSLLKGKYGVGQWWGRTSYWPRSGFLKVQPQVHHESPQEGWLGGETECHLSEQTLLFQKHPGGFLRGPNPRPLSRCFKDRVHV